MRVQHIEVVHHTRLTPRATSFTFRSDRPCHWLQRLCLFVLRRLQCYELIPTYTVERRTIDSESFMQRLFEAHASLQREFYIKPNRLLIGSEDYAGLMREATASDYLFEFGADYRLNGRIHGLSVQVIPWMRGILVMPKEKH